MSLPSHLYDEEVNASSLDPNCAVQAVLFDYGVVLSGPPDPAAWACMREITGLEEASFHDAYWTPRHDYDRGFHSGADYWRVVGRRAGIELEDSQVEKLLDMDAVLWSQVNEPMVAWAARLQTAGTRTGVLSNLGDRLTEGILARQSWLADFDFLLWSHRLHLAKPEPEIYRQAIRGLGVDAAHILFIDDRADNVQGGRDAGMQTIYYTTQHAFEQEIARLNLQQLWLEGR